MLEEGRNELFRKGWLITMEYLYEFNGTMTKELAIHYINMERAIYAATHPTLWGVFKNADKYGYKIFNRYARCEEHGGDEMDPLHMVLRCKIHRKAQKKIAWTQFEIMI